MRSVGDGSDHIYLSELGASGHRVPDAPQCTARSGLSRCTLPDGHEGPEHLTCYKTRYVSGPVVARWDVGPVVLAGPDPARDARRRVYAERIQRAAARALDKYIEIMFEPEASSIAVLDAGEAFVEAVGDYVEQRLQHNRHYGATGGKCVCGADLDSPVHQPGGAAWHRPNPRNPDYGVTDASAVHVPHLHEYDGSPCHKIECHELNNGESCTWCGGQPCRVVLAPRSPDYGVPCGDVYRDNPRYVCGQSVGHEGPHEYDDTRRRARRNQAPVQRCPTGRHCDGCARCALVHQQPPTDVCNLPEVLHTTIAGVRTHLESGAPCDDARPAPACPGVPHRGHTRSDTACPEQPPRVEGP